jgi:type 1 glutamine amidotransferase
MTLRAALITGKHSFDVAALQDALDTIDGVAFYPQHLEHFGGGTPEARHRYDVLVFYNFHQNAPAADEPWYEAGTSAALEDLGRSGQGIFVLHHGLVAYPEWPTWSEICGIEQRIADVSLGQTVSVQVPDPTHPITRGMTAFEIVDETYQMPSAGESSTILLTTEHPRSMRTLAWTRRYREAPVFCFQSGHDGLAYANPSFLRIVGNAVRWLAEA